MSSNKKVTVKWNIPQTKKTENKNIALPNKLSIHEDSISGRYQYSDSFEELSDNQTYSDTFVNDPYSDTFMTGASKAGNESDRNSSTTDIKTFISFKTSFDGSEIQDASYLETAKTEMLETVIEVDSDVSHSDTHLTGNEIDTIKELSKEYLDTYTSDSHLYSDTFESSERTKAESHYDETETTPSKQTVYSDTYSTKSYTDYSEEDESLLDRSYIAPDYDGKSLTDDEDGGSATMDDEYSYTFEPTEPSTYIHQDPEKARKEAEEINKLEQEKKDFVKAMMMKLKSKPEKRFSQLETISSHPEEAEEDDYLKHFCKKKLKLMKKKKRQASEDDDSEEDEDFSGSSTTSPSLQHDLLSDYGLPDSVLEKAKIKNILSAMKKAAKEEIHDPRKCGECRDLKLQLDEEDDKRQFVTAHAKRLKNKLMDAKVEEHMLKMNSISMIAELARDLPKHSEKPEKIFDKLFEPLLGKNVMR